MPLLPWNQALPSGAVLALTCTQPADASAATSSKLSDNTVLAWAPLAAATIASADMTCLIVNSHLEGREGSE